MIRFDGHRRVTKLDGTSEDAWFGYTCGHCGTRVAGAVVAVYTAKSGTRVNRWLACPECALGSVEVQGVVFPAIKFGPAIEGLPDDVQFAYEEARRCLQVNAYTAAELVCRKILMHVAVDKGAPEGESFAAYLAALESLGYVTPPMKPWVDLIRRHGNQATHRLAASDAARAESTVMFTAELLRMVYEMAHMARRYTPDNPTS